jgi:membrane-bound metal-dependent hydrolase YbcI (DUF457 family)
MFLLGHIGITVGIVYMLAWTVSKHGNNEKNTLFLGNIDFRFVIIASMLPDIIDKVVGLIILKEEISNGRIFTHSILVVGTITFYMIAVYKVRSGHILKSLFYTVSVWVHLLLDRMWEEPSTLLWPLFGTTFPRVDIDISDYLTILFSEPYILSGEVLGGLIIVALMAKHRLCKKTNLYDFLKHGRINGASNS